MHSKMAKMKVIVLITSKKEEYAAKVSENKTGRSMSYIHVFLSLPFFFFT